MGRLAGIVVAAIATLAASGNRALAAMELLMFEQPGCIYCARWDEQVSPEYPLTEEGKAAPLRRLQLADPLPGDVALRSRPVFTPTFVLVENGVELGRIEGYPGEDFFWPLLGALLREAKAGKSD